MRPQINCGIWGETNVIILKTGTTIYPSEDCFEDQIRQCMRHFSAIPARGQHASNRWVMPYWSDTRRWTEHTQHCPQEVTASTTETNIKQLIKKKHKDSNEGVADESNLDWRSAGRLLKEVPSELDLKNSARLGVEAGGWEQHSGRREYPVCTKVWGRRGEVAISVT